MSEKPSSLQVHELPRPPASYRAEVRRAYLVGAVVSLLVVWLALALLWQEPAPEPGRAAPRPVAAQSPAEVAPSPAESARPAVNPEPLPPTPPEPPPAASPPHPGAAMPPATPLRPAAPAPRATRTVAALRPPSYPKGPAGAARPAPKAGAPSTPEPAAAPAAAAAPGPARRPKGPAPGEVEMAVEWGRVSSPAERPVPTDRNLSYRLARLVNRSDQVLHLSSANLSLEDARGRAWPVSRYHAVDVPPGGALRAGDDPVVDERQLTVHFDHLPPDFEPDRLVLALPGGRLEVRVAGIRLERDTVPSLPTY